MKDEKAEAKAEKTEELASPEVVVSEPIAEIATAQPEQAKGEEREVAVEAAPQSEPAPAEAHAEHAEPAAEPVTAQTVQPVAEPLESATEKPEEATANPERDDTDKRQH